jgi:hypothetical protein
LVIQELDVHLEQQTVVAAWSTAQKTGNVWFTLFPTLFEAQTSSVDSKGRVSTSASADYAEDKKLYIDLFNLNPIKINISFLMSGSAASQGTRRIQRVESTSRFEGAGLLFAFSSFLRQVGEVVLDLSLNITDAPILISGMKKDNLYMSNRELTNKLQSIYFHSLVTQVKQFL